MAKVVPSKVVQTAIGKYAGQAGKAVVQNLNPLDALREIMEYMKMAEAERTERVRIRAKRDCIVESIVAQKEIILRYFELRFGERREALSHLFSTLDKGVTTKDEKLLDTALTGILGIIKDNPLKDFETFRSSMARDGFQLEL